ncbi:Rap1a/Tai family immunity protein [Pseudomonas brassicacearum]|uniref:Rap1a immunity protein domain-containing protein n=1 Tax=Pseudomonas brassicacearum TaxID=930166 RepID=A0A423JRF7_9PSED|nr:hypothetical protein BK664_06895 [Pseudomonas brassicacearum]
MKAGIAAAVGLIGTLASGSVMADGNELLKYCQATVRWLDTGETAGGMFGPGYCLGVINGVMSLRGITNSRFPKNAQTCIPSSVPSTGQTARILVKYMTENPEQLHLDEGFIAMLAIHRAFPCKE